MIGRLSPYASRSAATVSSVALMPSEARAGSPGSSTMNPNTSAVLTARLTRKIPERSSRRSSMASACHARAAPPPPRGQILLLFGRFGSIV